MVFSPLGPAHPGRGLAVVVPHLPLQHIRGRGRTVERGVQWNGVMGAMLLLHHRYGTSVTVPLLRHHRCPDSVWARLVQGRSMSSALAKAMKRCFGPAAFLQRFGGSGVLWSEVMGLCYCCTTVTVPPLRFLRYGSTVAVSPLP